MLVKKEVYLCRKCDNIVESLWNGDHPILCCGQQMEQLKANTVDAAVEKHVPVIERNGTTVTVKVGDVAHPMVPEHYILFVELMAGDKVWRHDFKEGDTAASAEFQVEEGIDLTARAYCNLHGFWSSK